MKNMDDELLNRYIDGEVTQNELNLIDKLLLTDTELKKRLSSLRKVHSELKSMKVDEPGLDFTARVMQRIANRYKVQRQQKIFIASVISFLGILCAVFFGFVLVKLSDEISGTLSLQGSSIIEQHANDLVYFVSNSFSGLSISVFGSILSVIILISAYFFFEINKNSKII